MAVVDKQTLLGGDSGVLIFKRVTLDIGHWTLKLPENKGCTLYFDARANLGTLEVPTWLACGLGHTCMWA